MPSGVMNFKDSFQILRAIIPTDHTFEGQFTARLRSLDRAIGGCIILYIVRIFSSSELVEPHIIPLKVRLAVALKEEAK